MRVLQIANYSETGGGISVQVKLLQRKLVEEGFICDIVSTKGSLWKRLKALLRLLSVVRKYDVCHVHACSGTGFFPAMVGISVGRMFNKRIVLTYHGGGAEAFFNKKSGLVKFFLNRSDVNIALSAFVGDMFKRHQIPYAIIPNIVELGENRFRDRPLISPHFISTRALEETYDVDCTLRAFQIVLQDHPDARMTVVGDGSRREHLESYVRSHDISNISFTGRVDNDTIYDFLDKADVLVSSARIDNMPVSVLEGFNAGLLVIASRVGGVPYMIEDGETGLLFESGNEQELAEKMIWAIDNPSLSVRMTRKARETIKQYSWENIRNKLLPLYQNG